MALPIRSIPTLKGEAAERFLNMIEENEKEPKVDFSKQIEEGRAILRKAKMLDRTWFLLENCILISLSKDNNSLFQGFRCGNEDLDDFLEKKPSFIRSSF